jgi:uncharacterized membrane protein YeaQ/YmgE (transglycosylase-associated protein family)
MTLTPDMFSLIIVFGILFGTVQCFFGYRLFKIIIGIIGFIIGGALAGTISLAVSPEETVALIAGLVGGIIGAMLLLTLYYVGIFFIGAFLGSIVGSFFYAVVEIGPEPITILIAAIITGIIALVIQKFMIIVSTSFGGSWLIVTGIAYFATGAVNPADIEYMLQSGGGLFYIILLGWIGLGTCGLIAQYKWLPTDLKRKERDLVKHVNSDKDE